MSTTGHSEDSLWQTCEENTMNEILLEPEKKHGFMYNISNLCMYSIYVLLITAIFVTLICCALYFVK